jgi:thymidine phosphorylase
VLRLKRVAIDTYGENVAYLSRACPYYRAEEFQALAKIEVSAAGRLLLATLNIVDSGVLLAPDELGLAESSFRQFGLPDGAQVAIAHATPPASLESVRRKIHGRALGPEEYTAIIQDIAQRRYSKMEIAAFVVAAAHRMTPDEVLALTRAMTGVGERLTWAARPVVDKHCIGGIPGNRTSMIVVPIVAAHGLTIPKTSSRAITSPAGTADTMAVLARVDFDIATMQGVVERAGGCLAWGGRANLSPADDILISVERPLGLDAPEQLVASILSKKLAAGATHLLIDIPVGPTAKVRSHGDANRLADLFRHVGQAIGLHIEIVLTDGSQPIGNGIGPVMEARDVWRVLENSPDAPADLRERSLDLAGRVLEFDDAIGPGEGRAHARDILESGRALAKMREIIALQGANPEPPAFGGLTQDVTADADGVVASIDCHRLARIARRAGAPTDPGAGIDLYKKVGDAVAAGEPLYRIYAAFAADFQFARDFAAGDHGYRLRQP